MSTNPDDLTHPATAHDWLSAEDVIRHALAAFYAKCTRDRQDADACRAEGIRVRFCRMHFADELADVFRARLHDQGYRKGILPFTPWGTEALKDWVGR